MTDLPLDAWTAIRRATVELQQRTGPDRFPGAFHSICTRARLAWAAAIPFVAASPVKAQDSSFDPAGSGPLVSAVSWLQGTLLGSVATAVAVIAVATVGFMMLTGRVNWRYGATVIIGCFVLFGAASIVAGIHATAAIGQ